MPGRRQKGVSLSAGGRGRGGGTLLVLAAALLLPIAACDRCGAGRAADAADGAGHPGAAADGGDAGQVSAAARSLAQSLDRAAAERLGSPCERAYAVLVALRKAASHRHVPRRDEYMEVCEQLPEAMQLCLSPAHQVDHLDECIAAREALDPELLRHLQELMTPR